MVRYRAVFMVPCVVEFENPSTVDRVNEQARRIADGMGRTRSLHPRQRNMTYSPKVLECIAVSGRPPRMKPELDIEVELDPGTV